MIGLNNVTAVSATGLGSTFNTYDLIFAPDQDLRLEINGVDQARGPGPSVSPPLRDPARVVRRRCSAWRP